MTAGDVRELVRHEPFEAFEIRLTDGRSFEVHHPEFVLCPPGNARKTVMTDHDGRASFFNVPLIVSLDTIDGTTPNGNGN